MDHALSVLFNNYANIAFLISFMLSLVGEHMYIAQRDREEGVRIFGDWFHFREFWHRFVGYLAGWYSLHLFIVFSNEVGAVGLSFVHLTLLFIAIIGIVGWLPYSLTGIINASAAAVKRLIDKI